MDTTKLSVNRRRLMALIGGPPLYFLGQTVVSRMVQATEETSPFPIVDVHCHVFNASDLPVRGFLQRVVFGDAEDQVVFDSDSARARALIPWLGATLVKLLLRAPNADVELSELRRGPRLSSRVSDATTSNADVERLRRALEETFLVDSEPSAKMGQGLPRAQLETGRELFLEKILDEIGPGPTLRALRADQERFTPLARGLLLGDGPISRHFKWARLLTSYRTDIVRRIAELYPGVALFVPALIDFSAWLEDEPRSPLEKQIEVMERIQRSDLGPAVHCMAPFDPWRQVLDDEAGRKPTAIQLVESAVMEMGFIGVKLYPPMGFLPTGNAGSRLTYPERAAQIPDFPTRIDQALDRLYRWAELNGVPIMAHATNSNGAADGYSLRAHPKGWAQVLRKYPRLRLNLAHFGGFDESKRPGDLGETWELGVGELLKAGSKGLYADLSYLHEFLPGVGASDRLDLMRRNLSLFRERFDPELQRLMYGSDWSMIGREKAHEQYLEVIRTLTRQIGATETQRRRIFSENAVRFLGLEEGRPAHSRLRAYYRRHQRNADWLRELATAAQ